MSYKITKKNLRRFEVFLKTEGKKILLYHNDPDGICSAAILLNIFPKFEAIPRRGPRISDDFIDELIRKEPRLVLFLDLPVDQEEKKIKRLQKKTGCRIMIVDHHIYEKNLDSEKILHLNPRFRKKKSYIPSSAMVYRILEGIGHDVKSLCWVAAMGVIGDYAFEDSKDLIEECRKEYPYLLRKHPLDSKLSEGADLITYSVIIKGFKGAGESLKFLVKSISYEEFVDNKKLQRWREEMKRELDFILKDVEREAHPEINLIIYTIKTRFNVASLVATYFSEKFSDKTIIVRKKVKDGWKLCLRNQSGRINLGKVVKKQVKGIGSGGGHEKAAGVMTTDWDRFKKRFISYLSAS